MSAGERPASHSVGARVRGVLPYVAVFAIAFAIYSSNRQTLASYDSAPNSLLAFNVLRDRRLDFDLFRGSYFTALGGQYAFTEAPNGHLTSVFPIGTAIVTLPLYAVFAVLVSSAHAPPISSAAFEPVRVSFEKLAAAAVAALAVALFLLCARTIAPPAPAALATAVFALATSMWSIASQGLWQHGPVNLVVLVLIYAFIRAGRAAEATRFKWFFAAGIAAGLLPVVRPTAALFSVAAVLFVFATARREALSSATFRPDALVFAFGAVVGVAPGVAWNAYFFHSLAGGYAGDVHAYVASPRRALPAFLGLLLSPSRGLLIFSPVLAFSVFGVFAAWRRRDAVSRLLVLLAGACAVLVVQYAFYVSWWAGYAYGPRFLCDTAAVTALLLVYVIPRDPLASVRCDARAALSTTLFAIAFCFSVVVQFAGVNSGAAGSEWNSVPYSVDTHPDRVWQTTDSQIERNVRAAYFRFFAWDIARSPAYERGLAARVVSISPSLARTVRGSTIDAEAVLVNDGRSPVYGYATGIYVGQTRVRARIVDARGRTFSEQSLYVSASPASGARALAIGALTMPSQSGSYTLECAPVVVGDGSIPTFARPLRAVLRVAGPASTKI